MSEYGITVRWDKNFLTLLHLTLARRRGLRMYGGVRFGGTLPIEDAWQYGFDHVAIAAGAGRPTIIDMKNNLIRGIRKASDFLMALQLTGAFKRDALPNLQVRLPAVVIGGGLTAIDTATELMAYYPVQVEKTLRQHEALAEALGEEAVRAALRRRGTRTARRVLRARARGPRRAARARSRPASSRTSCRSCAGGAASRIAYRKRMVDSPAYRLNHEEIIKALEEGIAFTENLNPIEAVPTSTARSRDGVRAGRAGGASGAGRGQHGHAAGAVGARGCRHVAERHLREGSAEHLHARCEEEVLPAAPGRARRRWTLARCRRTRPGSSPPTSRTGRFVSYYGDNHPRFAGNVVKAMASAKAGYPKVVELFAEQLTQLDPAAQPERDRAWRALGDRLDQEFTAHVEDVIRLTPTIVEVIVKAPAAARHFHPGQFYRLQNYESRAARVTRDGQTTSLLMEGIALTGAWVDKERGLLSMITLEMGASSRLVAYLRKGEPVVRDGADRRARPRSPRTRTCCCSAADSATRCSSRSRRRCATPATA